VVGEAGDGREALDKLRTTNCDVVLLDVNMPGMGGIDVLRELRASYAHLAVLVISMYAEDQYAARLLPPGASGYLAKGRSSNELRDAIRKGAAGGRYVTPEVAERLLDVAEGDAEAPPHERLSQREHQVFMRLAEGRSPSEIAAELSVSPSTVSTYIARI